MASEEAILLLKLFVFKSIGLTDLIFVTDNTPDRGLSTGTILQGSRDFGSNQSERPKCGHGRLLSGCELDC